MFGPFDGRHTPHPNSLLFNAFPGFWPFKMFWFFRKVSRPIANLNDSYNISLLYRLVRFSSSKTSLPLLRATPTSTSLASTSASHSITETANVIGKLPTTTIAAMETLLVRRII